MESDILTVTKMLTPGATSGAVSHIYVTINTKLYWPVVPTRTTWGSAVLAKAWSSTFYPMRFLHIMHKGRREQGRSNDHSKVRARNTVLRKNPNMAAMENTHQSAVGFMSKKRICVYHVLPLPPKDVRVR